MSAIQEKLQEFRSIIVENFQKEFGSSQQIDKQVLLNKLEELVPISNIVNSMTSKKRKSSEKKRNTKDRVNDSEPKIKKPRSAYIFYQLKNRENIKSENPGVSPKELMKLIGNSWSNLSEDEKKEYEQLHENDKERFLQEKENNMEKVQLKSHEQNDIIIEPSKLSFDDIDTNNDGVISREEWDNAKSGNINNSSPGENDKGNTPTKKMKKFKKTSQ